MKCIVLILFALVLDVGRCKHRNDYESNKVPKEITIKYFTKRPNEITIPIMMHLDKALTKTLPKESKSKIREKFKILAKFILRDVEELFSLPNLEQKIKFELLDLKILKNSTTKVTMTENVSNYLKSYCTWQGEKKMAKQKWYYSVLLTGLDLFYLDKHGKEKRSSTGRGYMKGICSRSHSCTLLEWHPKNIAYILAHEMAHSLGISHDGPPHNECRGQRYIMDAKYNPRNPAKIWSSCNKRALHQFLKSKYAWCLRLDVGNNTLSFS